MTPTPAPWTVTVLDQAVFIHGGPDNDEIADFSFADQHVVSISKEEAIANATLCAAAPDLLDLVKQFERSVEYEILRSEKGNDTEGATLKRITLNLIRAAIAKATAVRP